MDQLTRRLRCLGDETRLRMLHVLTMKEVTVTELATTMNVGQSRISTQLAMLRAAGLVKERREGKRSWLSLAREDGEVTGVLDLLRPRIADMPLCRLDAENLASVLERRAAGGDAGTPGGEFAKRYLPGRTWEGLARTLLDLVPGMRTVDIGIGDADLTLLLATFSTELVAIDPSQAALSRARTKAAKAGCKNIEFRSGEIESLPLDDESFDLVFASQVLHHARSPKDAVRECARVAAKGGRVIVLDLEKHREEWVEDRLGHLWLGFSTAQLNQWFVRAGLKDVRVSRVARDIKPPHFITLSATGVKR